MQVVFTKKAPPQWLLDMWKEIDDKTFGQGFDCFAEDAVCNLGVADWKGRGVKPEWRGSSASDAMPMIPISFVKDNVRLDYFSLITTVGTPQTVTAEVLRLECMFPANDATEAEHGRFMRAHAE